VGTITADYFEKTDAQWAELNGANRVLTYRATGAPLLPGLGLEWGAFTLSGNSALHTTKLKTDYVNLIAEISFHLFPKWLEYTLDLGCRLGVDRMELDRTTSSGQVNQYKIGYLSKQQFSRFGIRILLGENFFVGLSAEQQGKLFNKSQEGLSPEVTSGRAKALVIGYRFGSSRYRRAPTPSGKSVSHDPCLLHRVCDSN